MSDKQWYRFRFDFLPPENTDMEELSLELQKAVFGVLAEGTFVDHFFLGEKHGS